LTSRQNRRNAYTFFRYPNKEKNKINVLRKYTIQKLSVQRRKNGSKEEKALTTKHIVKKSLLLFSLRTVYFTHKTDNYFINRSKVLKDHDTDS